MHQLRMRDVIFALWSIAVGLAGIWLTLDYAPQARHFPQALSGVILLSGLVILVLALRDQARGRRAAEEGPLHGSAPAPGIEAPRDAPEGGPDTPLPAGPPAGEDAAAERAGLLRGALPFAAVLVAWALAVSYGWGYLVPGFVAGLALMVVAGARRIGLVLAGAAGTVLFCFTMFYLIFQTRIPETAYVRSLVAPLRDLF